MSIRFYILLFVLSSSLFPFSFLSCATAAETVAQSPVTTENPYVPSDELELILKAFTRKELLVEAEGWQALLRAKAVEIAKVEIAVKRQNKEIEKAKDIQDSARKAAEKLQELETKVDAAHVTGDGKKIRKVEKTAQQAQKIVNEIDDMIDDAAKAAEETNQIQDLMDEKTARGLDETSAAAKQAGKALQKVQDVVSDIDLQNSSSVKKAAGKAKDATAKALEATAIVQDKVDTALKKVDALPDQSAALKMTSSVMKDMEHNKRNAKAVLLENVNLLREERTKIIDNFKAVVTELAGKTDTSDSATQAKISEYQLYSRSVQGIHLDIADTTSSWIAIKGWIVSDEGGLRFALNFLRFLGILIVAWLFSKVASKGLRRALSLTSNISRLLSDFLEGMVRWIVITIGIIMALAAMEVSIAPLLALLGAAGFIIALALQDSLSNFASGIMILFFRPFDVDDVIDAGGVSGKVTTVSLVSTTIMTFDNKKMLVPNNRIWRDVITNATDVKTRRVDLEFSVHYGSDIMLVQNILEEIVAEHPKVLQSPAPAIHLHIIANDSIKFVCRPWIKSVEYWNVYWDLVKEAKLRFDAAGIEAPHPQQDVHLFVEKQSAEHAVGLVQES